MSLERARKLQQPVERQQEQKQVKVKVQKKQWISTGEKVLYSMATGLVVIASVFMVQFTSTTDTLNRDIQNIEQEISQQKSDNENIAYEAKELSNPDRILQIAKDNGLEMQNAEVKQAGVVGN
ncbi:cell division protein FtsL [Halobacillus sp. A5]|uniref:cell division protein FtsL n=1 Tax=Halobacillus sp. A5 TaxID=2880263 RepID=UPI0020A6944F|nr:cell division protein FtsL [Halobacillus sp. A5]MCP3026214.1 cell division protein FtsL [Halobacillus sp. A5]